MSDFYQKGEFIVSDVIVEKIKGEYIISFAINNKTNEDIKIDVNIDKIRGTKKYVHETYTLQPTESQKVSISIGKEDFIVYLNLRLESKKYRYISFTRKLTAQDGNASK